MLLHYSQSSLSLEILISATFYNIKPFSPFHLFLDFVDLNFTNNL